jgi:predicted MFS family arabinose efflux permease
MLLYYSMAGIGDAMVFPMLGTIIGETLPSEERSKALGLISAGQPISFVIGSPIVAYIASKQGWRMSFLFYMLPIVTISFLITYFGIPKTRSKKEDNTASGNLSGYKGVISNKSALSCLLGASIFQASMFTSWTYVISYFRQSFMISQSWTTILISLMAVCSAIGSLTVGQIVSKYGKKLATTFLSLLLGLSVIILYNSGNLWVSLAVLLPWAYVAGAGYVSGDALTLDQVPQYRGTLMSLNMVARSIGITLGGILGGSLLILFDYNIFGIIMGVIGILAATNYHLFTTESD